MKAMRLAVLVVLVLAGIFTILGTGGSSSNEERIPNNLELEVVHQDNSSKEDCLVSGSLTWNPDKNAWVARVNYYNSTPEPGSKHSVFNYVRYLPVPDWEGTDWETVDWESFPCDLNNLELAYFGNQLEVEIEHRVDLSKEDCLVSGSITWNPNKKDWVSRVNYYNNTLEPGFKHPVFEYIKYLPIPDWEGTAWETLDWRAYPCDLNNLDEDLFFKPEPQVANNLEVEVVHRNDSSKEGCLVSGSITWNPDKGKWVGRVNYYNDTPRPSSNHPAFEYIRFLEVPDWQGYAWETVSWKAFPCD